MTSKKMKDKIRKFAKELGLRGVRFDCKHIENNVGNIAGDHVFFGNMRDDEILLMVFCHEAGHFMNNKTAPKDKRIYTKYEDEFAAWCTGIRIARERFKHKLTKTDAYLIHASLDTYRICDPESTFRVEAKK